MRKEGRRIPPTARIAEFRSDYLIEVGQSTGLLKGILARTDPEA